MRGEALARGARARLSFFAFFFFAAAFFCVFFGRTRHLREEFGERRQRLGPPVALRPHLLLGQQRGDLRPEHVLVHARGERDGRFPLRSFERAGFLRLLLVQIALVIGLARGREEPREEEIRGVRDAVHGFLGGIPQGADGVGLGRGLGRALEARDAPALVRGHLAQVPRGSGFHQGDLGGDAQSVDVLARLEVVEAVEDDVEAAEEGDVKLVRFDVRVVRDDGGVGAELEHGLASDLWVKGYGVGEGVSGGGMKRLSLSSGGGRRKSGEERATLVEGKKKKDGIGSDRSSRASDLPRRAHLRLGHAHVTLAEQELAVEVADVDRVEVDHLDVPEPAQDERLEELAPDAAGAHHEDWEAEGEGEGEGRRG